MSDDSLLNRKSWARAVEPIVKIGYRDGASDGQDAVFQASFDMGYEEGLSYGFQIASHKALFKDFNSSPESNSGETLRISNCQICLTRNLTDNIHNLSNFQKEENFKFIKKQKVDADINNYFTDDNKKYNNE